MNVGTYQGRRAGKRSEGPFRAQACGDGLGDSVRRRRTSSRGRSGASTLRCGKRAAPCRAPRAPAAGRAGVPSGRRHLENRRGCPPDRLPLGRPGAPAGTVGPSPCSSCSRREVSRGYRRGGVRLPFRTLRGRRTAGRPAAGLTHWVTSTRRVEKNPRRPLRDAPAAV